MSRLIRPAAALVALIGVGVLVADPVAAAPPTADSGPDLVAEAGTDVVLAGTASDPDGDALEIRWILSVIADGDLTSCAFSGPTALEPLTPAGLAPTFNCTEPGQYLLQLVAADGTSSFDDLGASVTFTPFVNEPPEVDSGPSVIVPAGSDAQLNGSATDPDGDALEIRWIRSVVLDGDLTTCTFSGPTGFEPISAAGLAPTLNCTQPGQYLVQLVAGDGIVSVDDIGALVTFTEPIDDLTAPTCAAAGPASGGGFVVRAADPESGVAGLDVRGAFNLRIQPAHASFATAVPTFDITVKRLFGVLPGLASVQLTNGDGASSVCWVVVTRAGIFAGTG